MHSLSQCFTALRRIGYVAAVGLAVTLVAVPERAAGAQTDISTDEITRALLPLRTRGIHPVAPAVSLSVQFENGSAKLNPASVVTLDLLGRALSSAALANYKFRIEGHTDTVGNTDLNKTLSEQRAETVVDYLAAMFSIDKSRLMPVGMGEDGLLVPTGPNTPEAANRRVQVVNIGS